MGNKYEFWLSPEGLDRLRQWSGQGLNDAQIAREAGVRPDTLRAWKKKFPAGPGPGPRRPPAGTG